MSSEVVANPVEEANPNEKSKGRKIIIVSAGPPLVKEDTRKEFDKIIESLDTKDPEYKEKKKSLEDQCKKLMEIQPSKDDPDIKKYPCQMSMDEFEYYASELSGCHAVFAVMWVMGRPIFDWHIPTACVSFNRQLGGIETQWKINPYFWRTLNEEAKKFVIIHECLHIILKHGIRSQDAEYNEHSMINQAMDIVVNHIATEGYNIDRNKLGDFSKDLCWLDTCYKDDKNYLFDRESYEDKTMEWHYNRLKSLHKCDMDGFGNQCFGRGTIIILDDHSGLTGGNSQDDKDTAKDGTNQIIDRLNKLLTDDEKEQLRNTIENHGQNQEKKDEYEEKKEKAELNRGLEIGTGLFIWPPKKPKKLKNWELLVKEFYLRKKHVIAPDMQWKRDSRRHVGLPQDFIIPSENEVDDSQKKNKLECHMYMDYSGSCVDYAGRFFTAAASVPTDIFNLTLFCFDVIVHPVFLHERKMYGGGGTAFCSIEENIQQLIINKNIKTYPHVVVVITDGMGGTVNPQYVERWHWMLTEHNSKESLPDKSHIHNLTDFEIGGKVKSIVRRKRKL